MLCVCVFYLFFNHLHLSVCLYLVVWAVVSTVKPRPHGCAENGEYSSRQKRRQFVSTQ